MDKKTLFVSTMTWTSKKYSLMKDFSYETAKFIGDTIHFENKIADVKILNLLERLCFGDYKDYSLVKMFCDSTSSIKHNELNWNIAYNELSNNRENTNLTADDFVDAMSLIYNEIKTLHEYSEKFNNFLQADVYFENICTNPDFLNLVEFCFFGKADGWLEYIIFEKDPKIYKDSEVIPIDKGDWKGCYEFLKFE